MARGNSPQTQVFYKGSNGDQFCVFVESEELLKKWKADSTIPMTDIVAGWKIMVPEYVIPLVPRLAPGEAGGLFVLLKQQTLLHSGT